MSPFVSADAGGVVCSTAALCSGGITLPFRCDGPEDCVGGQICCATLSGSECKDTAQCVENISTYRMCNTNSDCAPGSGCCESTTLNMVVPGMNAGACVTGCN